MVGHAGARLLVPPGFQLTSMRKLHSLQVVRSRDDLLTGQTPASSRVPDRAFAYTSARRSDTGARQTRYRREWQPALTRSSRLSPTRQPCPEQCAPASTSGSRKEDTTAPSSRLHWEKLPRERTEGIQWRPAGEEVWSRFAPHPAV